jgi:hypothetical protein
MKKMLLVLSAFMVVCLAASGALAYTINDAVGDAIGITQFESYGIDVLNYTPGQNSGSISFKLYTNYPQEGVTVGSWKTTPADLFIKETYYGKDYLWAIPLVSRTGFDAGTMYAVGSYAISDDFDPSPGSFNYNHNVPVQITTIGNNYGWTSFGGGSSAWNGVGSNPNWAVNVVTGGLYQDDPHGVYCLTWGTATCANDVVQGCVPIPGAILLLGGGLVRLAAYARRRQD